MTHKIDHDKFSKFYDKWGGTRFPLPTEGDLRLIESAIKARLPDEYREFILRFNGGFFDDPPVPPNESCPGFTIAYLHGICATHRCAELGSDVGLFDNNDPALILPIGGTPGGHLLMMNVGEDADHGVIWLRTVSGTSHFVADGFMDIFDLFALESA